MDIKFSSLEKLRYTIQITPVDQDFFAELTELSLIAKGSTPEEAIKNLEEEKRNLFQNYNAAGLVDRVPLPRQLARQNEFKASMLPFLIKSSVVALIIVVGIFSAQIVVTKTVTGLPQRAASFAIHAINELGHSSQWVSEERKKEIGKSLRLLAANLKPFIEELKPVFDGADPPDQSVRERAKSGQ
jgi:hypothetical protein